MSSSKLREIYYQPQHLWKGQKAVKNLRDLSTIKPKVIKQWLSKQAFGKYIYLLQNMLKDLIMI